jgi:MoxR-like ATPase
MNTSTEDAELVKTNFGVIRDELSKMIVGQEKLIRNIFICLLCGGHALIEGVPGLGKTLIVKTLGQVLDLDYSRIQFTPDLMPADILGTNIVNEDGKGSRYFEFYKGPIFGQIILADEINRATPKTQSALLEAMQEEMVTIFGKSHLLKPPFIVIATQNPLEMEGTYPLPEAQLDRFFFKLKVRFPSADELGQIIDKTTEDADPEMNRVIEADTISRMKSLVRQVPVSTHVKEYAVRLLMATHPGKGVKIQKTEQYVRYGASPRGVQSLVLAGKVHALLDGRYNVAIEDIKALAKPALRHRMILNLRGEAEGIDTDDIIGDILDFVPEHVIRKTA